MRYYIKKLTKYRLPRYYICDRRIDIGDEVFVVPWWPKLNIRDIDKGQLLAYNQGADDYQWFPLSDAVKPVVSLKSLLVLFIAIACGVGCGLIITRASQTSDLQLFVAGFTVAIGMSILLHLTSKTE